MRKVHISLISFLCLISVLANQLVVFADFSKSNNKDDYNVFNINTDGYSYTIDTSYSRYGTYGVLYVNGEYIDDNVYWRYIADGGIVYYQKDNDSAVYKYDFDKKQREVVFYDSYCFLEDCYKNKYLYYSTDKYSQDPTDPGIVVYDLMNKKEVAYIDSGSIVEAADSKIFILPNTGDLYPLDIKMIEPDGSNQIIIANDASEMKVINNKLYYSAIKFGSDYSIQECIRCYDIALGNTVTLTDYFYGVVGEFYEDHVTVVDFEDNASTIYYNNTSVGDDNNTSGQNQYSTVAESNNYDNTAINISYGDNNPVSFMHDMDDDGVEDSISIYDECIEQGAAYGVFQTHVTINDHEYISDPAPYWLNDIWVIDIDRNDNAKEIVLTEGHHDSEAHRVIRYENGTINELIIDEDTNNNGLTEWREFMDPINIYVPGDGTLLISGEAVNSGDHFQVNDWYQEIHRGILTRMYGAPNKDETISVVLDGSELIFDQPPIIKDDHTLVPLRAIFEALGATVAWDGNTQTVTAQKGDIIIKLTIGTYEFYKNNDSISLDVPSMIVNDRTLVPVRAISEALDCDVDWNGNTKTVFIKQR